MNESTDNKKSPPHRQSGQKLLDFLAVLLGLETDAAGALATTPLRDFDDASAWLTDSAESLGMRADHIILAPATAAAASAAQTPLVACLDGGRGWLVLYGFSAGRVRAALVQGDVVEQRRIKPAAIAALLGLAEGRLVDWWLVQAMAPLANAVSPDHHAHLSPLNRLIELMRADHADLWLVLGLALGSGLLALASPVAVQALVNTVTMGGMGQPLLVLSIILFFFLTFAGGVHVLEAYLVEIVQRRIFVRLATDLAYRLPKVRIDTFDRHQGAELVNRFFDILTVQKAGSSLLLDGLSTAVQICVGLLMLAFYHPFLLAFDVVLLLSIGIIIFLLGRGGIVSAIQESLSKYALVGWLENVAASVHTFKFGGGPELASRRTDALAQAYLTAKRSHYLILMRQIIGSVALYAVASTALLAIGGYLVIDGHLTLGQLVAAELIVSSALISLIKFGKHLEGYYDMMAGADKIGHLLDLPLEREDGLSPLMDGPVALAVCNVCFDFGANSPVFSNLNFLIEPGEKIALFGGYASGKTTLANLLCGLRQPLQGHIEINGTAISSLRLEAMRRRIAVVSRMELIEDSLLENVRLGRSELGVDDVERALAAIGLSAKHLNTDISSSGAPLSTTEARLLLIARAIAGRPGLLIMDGILDELDDTARRRIAPVLFAGDAPWTLLVLTGSPMVADLCERVIKL